SILHGRAVVIEDEPPPVVALLERDKPVPPPGRRLGGEHAGDASVLGRSGGNLFRFHQSNPRLHGSTRRRSSLLSARPTRARRPCSRSARMHAGGGSSSLASARAKTTACSTLRPAPVSSHASWSRSTAAASSVSTRARACSRRRGPTRTGTCGSSRRAP